MSLILWGLSGVKNDPLYDFVVCNDLHFTHFAHVLMIAFFFFFLQNVSLPFNLWLYNSRFVKHLPCFLKQMSGKKKNTQKKSNSMIYSTVLKYYLFKL